jgi:hypothetical protein
MTVHVEFTLNPLAISFLASPNLADADIKFGVFEARDGLVVFDGLSFGVEVFSSEEVLIISAKFPETEDIKYVSTDQIYLATAAVPFAAGREYIFNVWVEHAGEHTTGQFSLVMPEASPPDESLDESN